MSSLMRCGPIPTSNRRPLASRGFKSFDQDGSVLLVSSVELSPDFGPEFLIRTAPGIAMLALGAVVVASDADVHAMDFRSTLAICHSILPLTGEARYISHVRFCGILAGAAESALGNHGPALEHLLT